MGFDAGSKGLGKLAPEDDVDTEGQVGLGEGVFESFDGAPVEVVNTDQSKIEVAESSCIPLNARAKRAHFGVRHMVVKNLSDLVKVPLIQINHHRRVLQHGHRGVCPAGPFWP